MQTMAASISPSRLANTTTFPGSDFYRIGVVEYSEKLHPDLANPTRLRGYVDMSSTYQ